VKYIKGKIYSSVLKFICRFPFLVKVSYNIFKNIIIHLPFLRTPYKWRMIRADYIGFEVERHLVKKEKLEKYNKLFNIKYYPSTIIEKYRKNRKKSGKYYLNITPKGLRITCRINNLTDRYIYLKINGIVIKRFSSKGLKQFGYTIRKGSLSHFPKKSILTLEFDNNKKILYKKSDRVELNIPFGDGTIGNLIEEGILLSKKGTLPASSNTIEIRREKYLNLYLKVKEVFDNEIDTPLFLIYGTLLGQIREGDFIANDDDFDAGYISLESDPKLVKKETLDIILKLLGKGFDISVNSIGRLFKISNETGVHLDVMPVWFSNGWNVAFWGASVKSIVEDYLPIKEAKMRGRLVYVPNKPEVFLSGYYGENWRTPDPGYSSNSREIDKAFLKNYLNYLLTPFEFKKFSRKVENERLKNISMGKFQSRALTGILKI